MSRISSDEDLRTEGWRSFLRQCQNADLWSDYFNENIARNGVMIFKCPDAECFKGRKYLKRDPVETDFCSQKDIQIQGLMNSSGLSGFTQECCSNYGGDVLGEVVWVSSDR